MHWLASLSVRRPVFATVLMLVVCVLGIAGYGKLGVDRFPKVDSPRIVISTELLGAAPDEVETELTNPIEEAVNTISGIDDLRSVSSEGVSQVFVSFVIEKDIEAAAQEVKEKLDSLVRDLPRDAKPPQVLRYSSDSYPVLYVVVDGPGSRSVTTEVADKVVRPRLEGASGVGQVALVGGSKRQINVWLDADRLHAFGLTPIDVQRVLAASNLTQPAGRVEGGPEQRVLRVHGRVSAPEEIGNLIIRDEAGRRVLVSDVARVEDGAEQRQSAAIRSGKPAVLLAVRKQAGANAIEMSDEVRYRLQQLSLPAGFTTQVIRDATKSTRSSVAAVLEHLLVGSVCTGLVVFCFLGNARSTLIAALAIPVSLIGTFSLMWACGLSIDTVTLLALALAVGIVIDDAIIVLENVHRTLNVTNLGPVKATLAATREIGGAVLATTLSLVAVFAPIAFMTGLVGQFLKSFGLTMMFAILISALVSFTLTPMLCSRFLGRPHEGITRQPWLRRGIERAYGALAASYERLLSWAMRRRWLVVLACVALLASVVPLAKVVPAGFLPRSDEGEFEVRVRTPEGSSLDATRLAGERIAREIRALPHVTGSVLTVGDNAEHAENQATILIELSDPAGRQQSQAEIMDRVRQVVVARQPPDLRIEVADVPLLSGGAAIADVEFSLRGPDLAELERQSARLVERLRRIPGAVDAASSVVTGKPELGLYIDRNRAAELGVRTADLAATLRLFVGGLEVSTYQESGERYPIFLRGRALQRADWAGLASLAVPSERLGSVRLSDLVEPRESSGPATIARLDRGRHVLITANLGNGAAASDVVQAFQREIVAAHLPPEYRCVVSGQSREMERTLSAFLASFALSFVFMYLVLAAQFESWLQPVTMLLALPLALPFALLSLLFLRQQLDIYSLLGLLVLFGMVKKNSILQIDHIIQLRGKGRARLDAIIEGSRDRLRPILMTSFAFVAGMLPLLFSRGVGAGFNHAIAGVIVGGQLLSLLLTLIATPVAYSLFDDAGAAVRSRLGRPARAEALRCQLAELELGQPQSTRELSGSGGQEPAPAQP